MFADDANGLAPGAKPDDGLTPSEAGKLLGVSRETARKWAKQGKIEAYVVDAGEWRIPRRAVEERLIEQGREEDVLDANLQRHAAPQLVNSIIAQAAARWNADLKATLQGQATSQVEALRILEDQLRAERERARRLEERLEAERSRGWWERLWGR